MKVLKSKLAKEVLADPKAAEQLRRFLSVRDQNDVIIEVRSPSGTFKLKPVIVPKAGTKLYTASPASVSEAPHRKENT